MDLDWPPLSKTEMDNLYVALQKLPKLKIRTACERETCTALAANFGQLFDRLNWNNEGNLDHRSIYLRGATGIFITETSAEAQALKEAIERHTSLKVDLTPSHSGPFTLTFGAKPPPKSLPAAVQQEVRELGGKLRQFSVEISDFAADREREKQRLPPLTDGRQLFERERDFGQENEVLMQRKFGTQAAIYLNNLRAIGVDMAWQVTVKRDKPRVWSQWFGAVGELLEQEKIVDARTMAADENYWFHQ